MYKKSMLMLLCLSIVSLSGCTATSQRNDSIAEYCYAINQVLKQEDFAFAEVNGERIVLYGVDRAPLSVIHFAQYDNSIHFLSIRKEENVIYFVTQGAVDDEEGYMFVNGQENSVFDGIWQIERVSGNGYAYSTSKP